MRDYLLIGLMLVASTVFGALIIFAAYLIRPKRSYPLKKSTYECGLETIGPTWVRFRIQFYLYALVFVIFDIETVFLYPWAVALDQLSTFALVEMAIFILILVVGLAYAWNTRALDWV
ncbi:MAG: NADH-quinone oxidoreductase subunit A [Chloroflexia bacterium]|nr:NADH-quinone oxidoreductase subunit A [Chloroflexia bacterium]